MAILMALVVFFVIITLTLIFGGISRLADKRVAREGRPTSAQRLMPERETPVT